MQATVVLLAALASPVIAAPAQIESGLPTPVSAIDSIEFARPVRLASGTRRALVLMVSHESLQPSEIGPVLMRKVVDEAGGLFTAVSDGRFELKSQVLSEPVLLPGDLADHSVFRTKALSAAVCRKLVQERRIDPDSFDILIYFYPTDTNQEPFGASWKTTSGSRFTPAVLNIGTGKETRPETIAHEIGHAFFDFGHAGSAHPKTGEVLQPTGDPYDLMGYGLDRLLKNPADMGITYRYYWGWTREEVISVAAGPGTSRLDPGRFLLVPTDHSLLWLSVITAGQAYADETGGLLIRLDKTNQHSIYHQTLDLTPETDFKADLHLPPGQTLVFDGRQIRYVRSLEIEGSKTPAAEIRIDDQESQE